VFLTNFIRKLNIHEMDNLIFTTAAVLEAFSAGRSGAAKAAAEFGVSRSAICQWDKNKPIPGKRLLHLYLKRPDIIQKVLAKQGITQQENPSGSKYDAGDDVTPPAEVGGAVQSASSEGA
jgi:hypothetical protein